MDAPIRAVIVEDEGLYRELLRTALASSGRVDVVGHFSDGQTALAQVPALAPAVAILDIRLGHGPNGIVVGRQLRRALPNLGIVLLSNYVEPSVLSAVPESETSGWSYLVKSSVGDVATLLRAIEGAAAGLVVLDPRIVAEGTPRRGSFLSRLTPRQQEILALMAQGYSNSGIAETLRVSLKTVANHVNILYQELEVERGDGALQPRVQAVLAYLDALRPTRVRGDA